MEKNKRRISKTSTQRFLFLVLALIILILAGWVRLYGINWDQGTHLHPDERYLTMVASAIRFPDELRDTGRSDGCQSPDECQKLYWDTSSSPLNPANYEQYASYVYGTLPLFFTRSAGRFLNYACVDYIEKPLLVYYSRGLRQLILGTNQPCNAGHYTNYSGIHIVGRVLSSFADLATLLGLLILTRLLYGDRIAILSGLLYAFTVLPIQHAHFFVVDSFATVFVIWTLMFCVMAYVKRQPLIIIIAGGFTGLAVASKISVWPLAGIVALTGLLLMLKESSRDRLFFSSEILLILLSLLISGIFAAVMFRTGQPYAFEGPGFLDIKLNPNWLATMKEIRELVSGLRDVPFGHQWTRRTPVIFPLKNMIFWGMGLPLGIAAWIGWGMMGWQLWKENQLKHAIPWIWGTLFFAYQSTQWVKSMRYLLPIYPIFVMMAAWFLVRYLLKSQNIIRNTLFNKTWIASSKLFYYVVLSGTFLWCCAFLHIYSQPLTRVAASDWMYENIPTAVTLYTSAEDIQIPMRTPMTLYPDVPATIRIPQLEKNATVTGISLNKHQSATPGIRTLRISLGNSEVIGTMTLEDKPYSSTEVQFNTPVHMRANQPYDLVLHLDIGDAVELSSSVIANEHWDDPLPQRLDGKDPFWNWYQSLSSSPSTQMNNYDNDNLEKRSSLLAWLNETDYIVLSSNRLYGSIPRLPVRYPFTVQYYESLFRGDLGFDLLAEFVSYPTLGPCQFPDQEIPFKLVRAQTSNRSACLIPFPPAEEAFSVYDHPTVLIFAKNDTYSSAKVASVLPESLLDNVQWMTPLEATRGKGDPQPSLIMDTRTRLKQEQGGTWSELFNRHAIQNKFPVVSVVLWWLLLTLLGWITFPWLYSVFSNMHFKGYGLSRIVGLLLWSYIVWLAASLRIVPFTRLSIWIGFILLSLIVLILTRAKHREMVAFIKQEWRHLLRLEVIFLVLFASWVVVRYLNPDLWHPVTGGEKPMDFAYLNAIIKSTWFPPYDPWFAGGKLNYYYFGFVMVGSLIKATGIIPSIGYNLAIPTFFSFTGLGAYTVAANLSGKNKIKGNRAGLWAILLVTILGNLGEARLLFKGYESVGGVTFESLIPGYPATISALVGLWKVVVKRIPLGFRPEWWYWDATRVIPFVPGEVGAINEFPAFTFLYADLHAHMMAFPLTLVALALMVQWAISILPEVKHDGGWLSARLNIAFPKPVSSLVFASLIIGALRATNTWDYPTYMVLVALGSLFPLVRHLRQSKDEKSEKSLQWELLLRVLTPIIVFLLAELFYLPFIRNYVVAYSSFEMWEGSRTPWGIFLIMYGQFLFPILTAAVYRGGNLLHQRHQMSGQWPVKTFIIVGVSALVLLLIFVVILEAPVAFVSIPLGLTALTFLVSQQSNTRQQLMWLWIGTALALSLGVEVIVLKGDIGRMNTVFKFYLQVWILLGLCAAVFIEKILHRSILSSESPAWIQKPFYNSLVDLITITLAILLFCAGLYPALAIPAKIRDRWVPTAPHTLDGAAFIPYAIQEEHGSRMSLASDFAVIHWLQENVEGSPTIMEAQAEREYLWGARISIHTGLPAIAAWRWHQVQQRLVMPPGTVEERQHAVRLFYNTSNPVKAMDILDEYGVKYVILTPYERAYMVPDGYAKFIILENQGLLSKVFENGDSAVYQVTRH